ncbi:hypothetical protein GYMLUDRAFT_60407 [Collybiopsis luxurians FD-317 M1]|uniref:Uncharacterized protein n=1 Tax=Collybiopsis luxurians FD-317 M1 TaxID=944289 RepID=A0A0D0C8M5_9AGAR|nr:hypothetical protein GYMLUDRAFT_60407 [Collybiopsis luxurians FD-317 M1]
MTLNRDHRFHLSGPHEASRPTLICYPTLASIADKAIHNAVSHSIGIEIEETDQNNMLDVQLAPAKVQLPFVPMTTADGINMELDESSPARQTPECKPAVSGLVASQPAPACLHCISATPARSIHGDNDENFDFNNPFNYEPKHYKVHSMDIKMHFYVFCSLQFLEWPPDFPKGVAPINNLIFVNVSAEKENICKSHSKKDLVSQKSVIQMWIWESDLDDWTEISYGDVHRIGPHEVALSVHRDFIPSWILTKSMKKKQRQSDLSLVDQLNSDAESYKRKRYSRRQSMDKEGQVIRQSIVKEIHNADEILKRIISTRKQFSEDIAQAEVSAWNSVVRRSSESERAGFDQIETVAARCFAVLDAFLGHSFDFRSNCAEELRNCSVSLSLQNLNSGSHQQGGTRGEAVKGCEDAGVVTEEVCRWSNLPIADNLRSNQDLFQQVSVVLNEFQKDGDRNAENVEASYREAKYKLKNHGLDLSNLSIAVEEKFGEIDIRLQKLQGQMRLGSKTKSTRISGHLANSIEEAFNLTLQLDELWVTTMAMVLLRRKKAREQSSEHAAALQRLGTMFLF